MRAHKESDEIRDVYFVAFRRIELGLNRLLSRVLATVSLPNRVCARV